MKTLSKILIILLITVSFASSLFADHPSFGFGSTSSGPIVTLSAKTLPAGKFFAGLRGEYIKNKVFSDAEHLNFADQDIHGVHSVDYLVSYSLGLGFGITDDLTLAANIPYVMRSNIREGEHDEVTSISSVEELGDPKGIGDLQVAGQYSLLKSRHQGLSIFLGIKAPTGKTDSGLAEVAMQPGSGSWDPFAGIAFGRYYGRMSFELSLQYSYSTEGEASTDLGDIFSYSTAFIFKLTGSHGHGEGSSDPHTDFGISALVEVSGETRQKTEEDGVKSEHEGGTVLYVSPGIRLNTSLGMSCYLSFGYPVYEDLNGEQSEPEYRIIGGVSFGF